MRMVFSGLVVEFSFFLRLDFLVHDLQDSFAPEAEVLVISLKIHIHQPLIDRLIDKLQNLRLHDLRTSGENAQGHILTEGRGPVE